MADTIMVVDAVSKPASMGAFLLPGWLRSVACHATIVDNHALSAWHVAAASKSSASGCASTAASTTYGAATAADA